MPQGFIWAAAIWWALAVFVNLATVILGWLPKRKKGLGSIQRAVSIIIPVKGTGPALRDNLKSFFHQDYPRFEILFAVADPGDPAIAFIERAMASHRDVPSRLITGWVHPSGNPKLDNIRRAWPQASHELVLICDVNARLRPSDLRMLSEELGPGVGLVTVAPVAIEPRGFVAEVEAAFFNGGGARWLIAAGRLGYGVGVGQTMLLRQADLERAGGIDAITSAFCEDAALASAIRRLSLKVRMASAPGWHPIGHRRFEDLWQRHLRWQCCRKYHAFPAFLCEPGGTPLATAIAGGLFLSAVTDLSLVAVVAGHLVASAVLEAAYLRRQGWPLSWLSPVAWLVRDLLIPALWLRALTARSLMWRGTRLQLPPLLAAGRQRRQ